MEKVGGATRGVGCVGRVGGIWERGAEAYVYMAHTARKGGRLGCVCVGVHGSFCTPLLPALLCRVFLVLLSSLSPFSRCAHLSSLRLTHFRRHRRSRAAVSHLPSFPLPLLC